MNSADGVTGGRDRAYATALEAFRRSPRVLRRLVVRMSTPNYTLGAVAVCLDSAGRVLLVRSRHHASWGLPGGLVRRGEQPVDGVTRELREELGVEVQLSSASDPAAQPITDLPGRSVSRTYVDTRAQQVTVVFVVDGPVTPRPDGVEVVRADWFDPTALPAHLVRGTRETLALMGVAVDHAS